MSNKKRSEKIIKQKQLEDDISSCDNIEYIDYDKIKNFKYKITEDQTYITVKCFFNGNKWICPNPYAEKLCDYIENWYMSTECIKTRSIVMPSRVFDDVLDKMTQTINYDNIILSEL